MQINQLKRGERFYELGEFFNPHYVSRGRELIECEFLGWGKVGQDGSHHFIFRRVVTGEVLKMRWTVQAEKQFRVK